MKTYILKIGGSSVTEKDANEREARADDIRGIAKEIKNAKKKAGFRLIVVHGAGPFGHKLVKDYGINDGVRGVRDIEGFVRTHNSMEDLNKVFMDVFREVGLLGFPIQPSACIVQDNRRITSFDTGIIDRLLEMSNDIIPILYGDMVIDESLGASVVSGDAIVPYLARKLKVDKVLMGTDVDGIFSADPKTNPDAKLIETIGPGNLSTVLEKVSEAVTVDVTQGMKGKIMKIAESLQGIEVLIFNIKKKGNTENALRDLKVKGTRIMLP
ncbi:MAG: hypothetical protein DRO99_01740 [Candidatus Aenigmatarchaeota archaeon]|nr:MAG: hypothetical protein DRO99_01740 [Candidatus Aenigmarchaeota archaeon]